ncbi:MAG: hypothetical protein JWQ40_5168 [Segetibacter sp.]|jgi:hypothetical protein|nr:hypothetical protein [Segetibacter sp.]
MTIKKILAAVSLFFSISAMSQENDGKNMGKVNLSAFTFKGLGVQYERQVGRKVTVAMGLGIIPKSTIAFKSAIEKQIDDPDVKVGDFRLGTTILTPEVRYYFSQKGAFHGFYLAPYARFGWYNLQGPVSYSSSTGFKRDAVFNGKLNTITGGLMAGSSWHLSKRLYLDLWIIGASYGGANGNLVTVTPLNAQEQQSLKRELDEIEIAGTTMTSEVNSNGATVTTKGSMVGARGLGINLGIRF